jgi:hypothetical protein
MPRSGPMIPSSPQKYACGKYPAPNRRRGLRRLAIDLVVDAADLQGDVVPDPECRRHELIGQDLPSWISDSLGVATNRRSIRRPSGDGPEYRPGRHYARGLHRRAMGAVGRDNRMWSCTETVD